MCCVQIVATPLSGVWLPHCSLRSQEFWPPRPVHAYFPRDGPCPRNSRNISPSRLAIRGCLPRGDHSPWAVFSHGSERGLLNRLGLEQRSCCCWPLILLEPTFL